jgi:hypothetical protein
VKKSDLLIFVLSFHCKHSLFVDVLCVVNMANYSSSCVHKSMLVLQPACVYGSVLLGRGDPHLSSDVLEFQKYEAMTVSVPVHTNTSIYPAQTELHNSGVPAGYGMKDRRLFPGTEDPAIILGSFHNYSDRNLSLTANLHHHADSRHKNVCSHISVPV